LHSGDKKLPCIIILDIIGYGNRISGVVGILKPAGFEMGRDINKKPFPESTKLAIFECTSH
jgi:hypothetical protein